MSALANALDAVAAVLDTAVALDPDAPARVERLAGRPLEIHVTGFDCSVFVAAADGRLELTTSPETAAVVRISGPPASLAALAGGGGTRVLFGGELDVSGDVTTARAWQRLFDTLDPDWEEALAHVVGDIPAHEAARIGARLRADAGRAGVARAADLRAWLVNEAALVPARPEVEERLAAVDTVRHDVDRLAARVARLERHAGTDS